MILKFLRLIYECEMPWSEGGMTEGLSPYCERLLEKIHKLKIVHNLLQIFLLIFTFRKHKFYI